MKKLFTILSLSILVIFLITINVFADLPQQVCKMPQQPVQNAQVPQYAPNTMIYPVMVSSLQAGSRTMACGVATFSASLLRSNVLDSTSNPIQIPNTIQSLATAGHLTSTNAGRFDDYISGVKTNLNNDPVNCYKLTIKRITSFANPPVLTLPTPTTEVQRNIKTITYVPYNFRISDISEAILSVIRNGGIGMGGVVYDAAGKDTAAHMFQPLAVNLVPTILPSGERRYHMKIYDPYFGAIKDVQIVNDSQNRIFSNLWVENGVEKWFHLEELYTIENLGNCTNITWYNKNNNSNNNTGGGGGSTVTTVINHNSIGPYTSNQLHLILAPTSCGVLTVQNTCNSVSACPIPGDYCSASMGCSCKTPFCGDGEKAPSEQCDDGNMNDNDGCSSTCRTEFKCGNVWVPTSQFQCSVPGTFCYYSNQGNQALGYCNEVCRCMGDI